MVFFDNKIITLNSAYGYKQNGTLSSFVLFNFQGLLKEEKKHIKVLCIGNKRPTSSLILYNQRY